MSELTGGVPSFRSFPRMASISPDDLRRRAYHSHLFKLYACVSPTFVTSSQNVRIMSHGSLLFHFTRPSSALRNDAVQVFTNFMDSLPERIFLENNVTRRFDGPGRARHMGWHIYTARHDDKKGRKKGKRYLILYSEIPGRRLCELDTVFEVVDGILKDCHPLQHSNMHARASVAGKAHGKKYFFLAAALNHNKCISTIHTDDDDGLTTIFFGGSFKKGYLCIPQLNLHLMVRPGDIVWFRGCFLHYVESEGLEGIRYSISMYCKTITGWFTVEHDEN